MFLEVLKKSTLKYDTDIWMFSVLQVLGCCKKKFGHPLIILPRINKCFHVFFFKSFGHQLVPLVKILLAMATKLVATWGVDIRCTIHLKNYPYFSPLDKVNLYFLITISYHHLIQDAIKSKEHLYPLACRWPLVSLIRPFFFSQFAGSL